MSTIVDKNNIPLSFHLARQVAARGTIPFERTNDFAALERPLWQAGNPAQAMSLVLQAGQFLAHRPNSLGLAIGLDKDGKTTAPERHLEAAWKVFLQPPVRLEDTATARAGYVRLRTSEAFSSLVKPACPAYEIWSAQGTSEALGIRWGFSMGASLGLAVLAHAELADALQTGSLRDGHHWTVTSRAERFIAATHRRLETSFGLGQETTARRVLGQVWYDYANSLLGQLEQSRKDLLVEAAARHDTGEKVVEAPPASTPAVIEVVT